MLNYQRVSAEWGLGRVWLVASNMELWSPPSRGFSSFLAVQRDMAWLRSRCLHQIHECLRICQFRRNPAIYWLVDLFSKLFACFAVGPLRASPTSTNQPGSQGQVETESVSGNDSPGRFFWGLIFRQSRMLWRQIRYLKVGNYLSYLQVDYKLALTWFYLVLLISYL